MRTATPGRRAGKPGQNPRPSRGLSSASWSHVSERGGPWHPLPYTEVAHMNHATPGPGPSSQREARPFPSHTPGAALSQTREASPNAQALTTRPLSSRQPLRPPTSGPSLLPAPLPALPASAWGASAWDCAEDLRVALGAVCSPPSPRPSSRTAPVHVCLAHAAPAQETAPRPRPPGAPTRAAQSWPRLVAGDRARGQDGGDGQS